MSNDFDDATQLGSIGHNPSVPSQPGQQQPAFHTPNLPEQPQADEDPEGTLLSAHGTAQPALPQQLRPGNAEPAAVPSADAAEPSPTGRQSGSRNARAAARPANPTRPAQPACTARQTIPAGRRHVHDDRTQQRHHRIP